MTRIFTILLFVVALGLGYFLFNSIKTDIELEEKIRTTEARVINKLMQIRDAQIAYQAIHGRYTDNWDSLKNFIENGVIYNVVRTERVIPKAYGQDSIIVNYDTLGTVAVKDSLFNERKYPNFNLENLEEVPGSNGEKEFELYASEISKKTGAIISVFEVKDTHIINPERRKEGGKGPLRVGSRDEASTQGNWEF